MTKKKCPYCNKEISDNNKYCDEQCESLTCKYNIFENKYRNIFSILISIGIIINIAGAIITTPNLNLGMDITYIGLIILGFTMIIFPFGTSETFKMLGIKRTTLIIRGFGIVISIGSLIYMLVD